jgi:capsular polysaccharide transport system permease protein
VFALPVLFVWRAVRDPNGHGLWLVPFLWSGYLPLLLFRHLGGRMLMFIRANVPLLYHQRVGIFYLVDFCRLPFATLRCIIRTPNHTR